MTKVVAWATHLQTDILALCAYLDRCEDVELLIVAEQAAAYLQEPIARMMPLKAQILDRNEPDTLTRVREFGADVVVADNHVPPRGVAPRLFYMWHGMGWKARSRLDLQVFYRQVRQLTGDDPRKPSSRFRAQCYGPTDLLWRNDNWGIPEANCVVAGMCFSDLLSDPPYGKEAIAGELSIDVLRRKTVLLSITWHYGGIFARDGSQGGRQAIERDMQFVRRIGSALQARQANLLLCLHDRKRYDPDLLAALEEYAQSRDHVAIRFKSEHPDNIADLLVADVMVSNLSSFIAYFYLLGRPAVHVMPASSGARYMERVIMLLSRFRWRTRTRVEDNWMLDPGDIGGVAVSDEESAIAAITAALASPDDGARAASAWLARHVSSIDGQACQRMKAAIDALAREA